MNVDFDRLDHNRGLVNYFSGIKASPEQAHDLLHMRSTGEEQFHSYVEYNNLKKPSTPALRRKLNLKTFSTSKRDKKKADAVAKEKKLLISATENSLPTAKKTA